MVYTMTFLATASPALVGGGGSFIETMTKEKTTTKEMIAYLKKGYGADCKDYVEDCPSCEAKKVIQFLENHLKLLDY